MLISPSCVFRMFYYAFKFSVKFEFKNFLKVYKNMYKIYFPLEYIELRMWG